MESAMATEVNQVTQVDHSLQATPVVLPIILAFFVLLVWFLIRLVNKRGK